MVLMVFLCVGKHALLHIEATVKMLWAFCKYLYRRKIVFEVENIRESLMLLCLEPLIRLCFVAWKRHDKCYT